MGKNIIKSIIKTFFICLSITILPITTLANDSDLQVEGFEIIPKLTEDEIETVEKAITDIGDTGNEVWDTYNQKASELKTSQQIASGIMNRDTIMNYLIFIVQFLSQLGLVVGVGFIMFAGYKYIISVFNGLKTPTSTIKNAIIGVIVVIFSFAIMRILTSIIGLT